MSISMRWMGSVSVSEDGVDLPIGIELGVGEMRGFEGGQVPGVVLAEEVFER